VEDLSVKMWYPDQVKPGEMSNVSLEIRNENYDHPVNITWTGINIEWMNPGDFAYNTTSFKLSGGQSRIVNIVFQVPSDARAKKYSNYEVIYYTIQNGTGGEWSNATWESVITDDFKVVKPNAQSQDWYSWATSNAACLCTGLIAVVVIAAVAQAARKGVFRRRWRARSDTSVFRPSASPPSGYTKPKFPPAPYEETRSAAPEKTAKEPEPEPQEPGEISEPLPVPSPPPLPKPAQAQRTPSVIPAPLPDRGVDLMRPTDWDAIGKTGPNVSAGPAAVPPASLDMGPKFCTYCGIPEPGPVCRNCGRRLV
jgi:hypothetical protein